MTMRKDFVAGARDADSPKGLAIPDGVRAIRERLTRKPDSKTFLIQLTTWQGSVFHLRYTAGRPVAMESAAAGGTYLYSGARMVYVADERDEIERQIKRRGG
jgi:hypothetical protein